MTEEVERLSNPALEPDPEFEVDVASSTEAPARGLAWPTESPVAIFSGASFEVVNAVSVWSTEPVQSTSPNMFLEYFDTTALKRRLQQEIERQIDALLNCPPEGIRSAGTDLLRWLDRQPQGSPAFMARLEERMRRAWRVSGREDNLVAALELLVLRGWKPSFSLLGERLLFDSPISETHRYLIALAGRAYRGADAGVKESIVSGILSVAARAVTSERARWTPTFFVELVRALAEIRPGALLSASPRWLESLNGMEESAVLETVCICLRAGMNTALLTDLRRALEARWDRLIRMRADEALNWPGILACLFECLGRCGYDLAPLLEQARQHAAAPRLLFAIAHRHLQFADSTTVVQLYRVAISKLLESGQIQSATAVMALVAKEVPQDFESIAREVFCER
jgi:hypothetical protein